MKYALISFLTATSLLPNLSHAITSTDLKLNCQGHYQVLSATPYYDGHFTNKPVRYIPPPEAGAKEIIQIIDLIGVDCAKLKSGYGLEFLVGQKLDYTEPVKGAVTLENAVQFAAQEIGATHSFAVQQQFTYQDNKGNLPLYPLVHEEYAYALNQVGKADAGLLYGVPSVQQLTDSQKLKALDILYEQVQYGKIYAGNYNGSSDQWLKLILNLTPTESQAAMQYAADLKNLFANSSHTSSTFYTLEVGSMIGQKLNKMLNLLGGTKWQTKLQIVEQEPLLLDFQLITWSQEYEALELNSQESEDFLTYALAQVQYLVKLPQLTEAVILFSQYQNAAKTLLEYSKDATLAGYKYELSNRSLKLIEDIEAIHYH